MAAGVPIEPPPARLDAELAEAAALAEAEGERLLAEAQRMAGSVNVTLERRALHRIGRRAPKRECIVCGRAFEAAHRDALYCGQTCRKRASRAGLPRWRSAPSG